MLTGHLKYLMAFTFLTCAREFPERYYTPLATRARTPPLRSLCEGADYKLAQRLLAAVFRSAMSPSVLRRCTTGPV